MNRIIKFRGKRKDNGQWVIGSYHYCTEKGTMRFIDYKDGNRVIDDERVQFNCHWIFVHQTPDTSGWDERETFKPHAVIAESVGQFTGLRDKNGKDIYEGDIVQFKLTDSYDYNAGYDFEKWHDTPIRAAIKWSEDACGFRAAFPARFKVVVSMFLIIGNAYDYPYKLTPPDKRYPAIMIDPKEAQEEVEEQAEQVSEPTESAEEGGTEG